MSNVEKGTLDRAMHLRRMMNEFLRGRSPQERDRMIQSHLAQARGPVMNALLLRKTTNAMLLANAANKKVNPEND